MIHSPVFIIGCPRSGTSLLFNILSEVPELWSIGFESKRIIEKYHHPRVKNWESGALDSTDLTEESGAYIISEFEKQSAPGHYWKKVNRLREMLSRNSLYQAAKLHSKSDATGSPLSGAIPQAGLSIFRGIAKFRNYLLPAQPVFRLLEKTPENCLRLPFLETLFPDMLIIYITRDGRSNVNSLIEGWRQPHLFPGYQIPVDIQIPGLHRNRWAFTLIPGWKDCLSTHLEEVCAWQWIRCNEAVLAHKKLRTVPYLHMRYEELIAKPGESLHKVARFIDVEYHGTLDRFQYQLPYTNVISNPDLNKWRWQNKDAIERVIPIMRPILDNLGYR